MKLAGFERSALQQLEHLPSFDAPPEVERRELAAWCASQLSELLPTHRWLVNHLFLEDDAG